MIKWTKWKYECSLLLIVNRILNDDQINNFLMNSILVHYLQPFVALSTTCFLMNSGPTRWGIVGGHLMKTVPHFAHKKKKRFRKLMLRYTLNIENCSTKKILYSYSFRKLLLDYPRSDSHLEGETFWANVRHLASSDKTPGIDLGYPLVMTNIL